MLTPSERELILICARQNVPAESAERATAILDSQLNWDELIATAWRHGVGSLLFRNMQSLDRHEKIPARALHLLRQTYVRASVRNQAHFAAIAELLDRFAADKIDIMLLKGAALAPRIYRDPALRPFADIDLLVRKDKIDTAKEILLAAGYEIAPELLSERFNRKYHVNLPFVRKGPNPVHIELHWKLADPFSEVAFDHEALFARANGIRIADRPALVLSAEDEIVYLASHLDNHGYLNHTIAAHSRVAEFVFDELSGNRLIWFTDLQEIISAGGFSWEVVRERARVANATDALAVTLQLLHELHGMTLPPHEWPLPKIRWPERMLSDYVLSIVDLGEKRRRSREFFLRKFLTTRKGFELRLVRLVDVWKYVFPDRARIGRSYLTHVCGALSHCLTMLMELELRRAFRFLRARPS
jgi:hypothetical protein